jgi:hypothetical protein
MTEVRILYFYPQQAMEAWNHYHERLGRLHEIADFAHADVPYDPKTEAYLLGRAAVIATELGINTEDDYGGNPTR